MNKRKENERKFEFFWIPAKLGIVGKQLELKEYKFNTKQECEEWIEKTFGNTKKKHQKEINGMLKVIHVIL